MNESISIKEGNIGRRIAPVDKLKINTTSDDESMWVPAERGNTGVLYASENGIYIASEDGYESYSEVVVRVTEESFYGDNDFDHWHYEVPTDFPDLWDSLTLDDFNIDPLAFDDLFNNKDVWDMDIPDLPDKLDFKMKDLKTKKPKKEKITGIDPVSGNEMAVGLDNFGQLTQEILPTSIGIINLPSKLIYKDGETILFSGLVVQAYTADGNVWSNSNYPNGIIPMGELFFPVTVAVYDGNDAEFSKMSDELNSPAYGGGACSYESKGIVVYGHYIYDHTTFGTPGGASTLYQRADGELARLGASKNQSGETTCSLQREVREASTDEVISTDGGVWGDPISHEYTHNGKTVYYSLVWMVGSQGYKVGGNVTSFASGSTDAVAWALIYGEDIENECKQEVPVQWFRPGDGQMLETSFEITVTKGDSGESGGGGDTQAITYNGTRYIANEDMNAEAHYQSGTVWIRGEAKVWSVPDAVAFGLLKPEEEKDGGSDSGSEHEGGHF